MPQPTEEQLRALERFRSGRPLKINAFAGAGKTTTLQILASSRTTRGTYLAFNRSIANEAAQRFPPTVDCRTTHSLAWQAVQSAHRFSTGKMKDRCTPISWRKSLPSTITFSVETYAFDRCTKPICSCAH